MPILPIGHTPGKHGDMFPVRNRFDHPPDKTEGKKAPPARVKFVAPPPPDEKHSADRVRGFTTADWKAKVMTSDRKNVRPPDKEKMGFKHEAKQANAGGQNVTYNQDRYSKVVRIVRDGQEFWHKEVDQIEHTQVDMNDPDKHPYPWKGRADDDLIVWAERAREFAWKKKQDELQRENRVLRERVKSIRAREAIIVRQEQTPPTRATQPRYSTPKQSMSKKRIAQNKAQALASVCPQVMSVLSHHKALRYPPTSLNVSVPEDPPHRDAAKVSSGSAGRNLTMYQLKGLLLPGRTANTRGVGKGEVCVLRLGACLRDMLRDHPEGVERDLRTELSILLGVEEGRFLVLQVVGVTSEVTFPVLQVGITFPVLQVGITVPVLQVGITFPVLQVGISLPRLLPHSTTWSGLLQPNP
eukprot:CAMPEP_0173470064 /NCGR_PEP_ID=MMETSP1357-20121228/77686_1 /TAXON_ID=77926 /ORGANISM="Hemiselmis rufescens, Strain PCC563" /LENGTH=411 /DNA_ID=CAMNT_0014438325 /DNA_START=14 /DNA_END=1250 /DNA_ORIENTATION=-